MKFYFYKQHDSMQCGAACLAMICAYYKKKYPIEQIAQLCRVASSGVSVKGIADAASQLGLESFVGYFSLEQLQNIPLPCIIHWNQNHFVVLYQIKKSGYVYIADPGKGKVRYSIREFKKHWINSYIDKQEFGVALLLNPTNRFGNIVENYSQKRSLNFILDYIKQYNRYFKLIIIGLFLGCILQFIMPFLTQLIVDVGVKNKDIDFIWIVLLGEFMIVVGCTFTDFIRRWLLLHISMRINISLVSDFLIKLMKLPMSFFDARLLGDILQRINDHERVQIFLTTQAMNMVFSILTFMVFSIVMCMYNTTIFIVFLLGSLIYILWLTLFFKRRKIIDYELFEQQAINHSKTYQLITSIQEIKLQNCERRRRWEWEDIQADLFAVQMKSLKLQQSQEAGSIFINEVKNITVTVLAATSVINEQMTLGAMLAIQYIIGQLNSPVEQFMNFIYSLQDVRISLDRINEIHSLENEEHGEKNIDSFKSNDKTIIINDVNFRYDIHSIKNTLEGISIKIPSGKITAIVGSSGSGKTTLIKLILGYYPVMNGYINIAGYNINKYNLKWWRKQCGVVMQDGIIFSESIARNIAVDDEDIDVQKLKQASKIANIYDYIMSLPLQYDTIIGVDGGIGLSQGQRQRILIARAIYKDPPFIFLDEATNALDAKNERIIVENLNKFYKGRTVVIVAHRLSTVKNADQIIVLDKGEVVEIGNHVSLIKEQGVYYNLVKNQLELGV